MEHGFGKLKLEFSLGMSTGKWEVIEPCKPLFKCSFSLKRDQMNIKINMQYSHGMLNCIRKNVNKGIYVKMETKR